MAGGHYRDHMPQRVIYLQVAHYEHDAEFGQWSLWKEWRCAAALRVDYQAGRALSQKTYKTHVPHEMWMWIERQLNRRRATWLVAEDIGSALTLSGMWQGIGRAGYKLRRIIMSDPPTVVTLEMGRGTLTCVDLRNYVAQVFCTTADGLPTTSIQAVPTRDDQVGWLEWCAEQCRSLCHCFTSIMSFASRYGNAVWSISLPGIAWRIWRTWYSARRTAKTHLTAGLSLERASYYPGECAAYRVGSLPGAFAHCDVNSLYPWTMLHGLYPVSPLAEGTSETVRGLIDRCNDGVCAARVCVRSEDIPYPRREGVHTFRTVGKFWTVLAGPELKHALDTGRVCAVCEWVHYRAAPLFVGWVTDLYAERLRAREKGDKLREGVIKLTMNALSGKFNQRLSDWRDRTDLVPPNPYGCWTCYDYLTGEARYYRAIAGHVQERTERRDWAESRPLIAACITAYGRERMRQLRASAGDESVCYQDTDSLILRESSWRKLVRMGEASDTRLGGLRLLGVYDGAHIYGPKRYALGGKITMAGVDRSQAVSVDGTYTRQAQQSMASSLLDEPQGYVGMSRKTVRLRDIPKDATVCQDGTVLPITLWED